MDWDPFEPGEPESKLSTRIGAFCAMLRREHGFRIGLGEAQDALRAVEAAGATNPRRFRAALRTVLCGRADDLEPFERAFDDFFLAPPGQRSGCAPRHSSAAQAVARRTESDAEANGGTWEALLAKYSPLEGRGAAPELAREDVASSLRAAGAFIASVRRGRSRRWRPQERGPRFDLRRTLRTSLHTAGEPVQLKRLGHPLRNPRFVILIDGSRSMSEQGQAILTFAYALVRRTLRARAFTFSTQLREITRDLRRGELPDLGEAWGGGTRIGSTLQYFLRTYGALLGDETVCLIFSDGLDFGEPNVLAAASAELRRRCAALIWLSPNAGLPGYVPETRGMRAVLPSLSALIGVRDLHALARIGGRL